jgi:uncharacterized membrane protein
MNGKTASTRGARYGFIDLLRGLALVVMVETHVVNAYLPVAARRHEFFFWLSFINGLVAPAFLFATGFSLSLQARRQWEDWLHLGPAFRKQVRRLGFILLIAYYMHLPHFGLSRYLVPQGESFWKSAFQVDVLQCIVVSLLAVDLLILLTRRQTVFVWAGAALGAAAAVVTPWFWAQDFIGRMPLALALYLNPHRISLFPLFPWISFVIAGTCAGHFFLDAVGEKTEDRHMRAVVLASLTAIPAALAVRDLDFFSAWKPGFYTISPLYVIVRLGCVLILCAGLYFVEKRLGWVPRILQLAGQESLLVYCFHLLLIFSFLRQPPVAGILGREAGYGVCALLSLALILLMLLSAAIWHGWKKKYPHSAKYALIGSVAISIVVFLFR